MSKRRSGAKQKILEFFLENIGTVLDGKDIQAAGGGVTEWARRVRELRNEEGYQILSHKAISCCHHPEDCATSQAD